MALTPDHLAQECVFQGLFFGVNPHYLVAVAQLRSGISDVANGNLVGPFQLTQSQWDSNCSDAEFAMDFASDDITSWRAQCAVFALMAFRQQSKLIEENATFPSAVDLFKAQWPDDKAKLPDDMQAALNKTAALIDPAAKAILDEPPQQSIVIDDAKKPAPALAVAPKPTEPGAADSVFRMKAPSIMAKLMNDFAFTEIQAAGILGNLGHESDGFRQLQEQHPKSGRGGFGWAQWTGERRVNFEKFCDDQGLQPSSDVANYGFLKRELLTTEGATVPAVKQTTTLGGAVRAFETKFERADPELVHFDSRDRWAQIALNVFKDSIPADVLRLLDPDLMFTVAANVRSGSDTFWLIDQFNNEGEQILIRKTDGDLPRILAHGSTVFPLQPGIVPASVAFALGRSVQDGGGAVPATPVPHIPAGQDASALVLPRRSSAMTRSSPETRREPMEVTWHARGR